MALTDKKYSNEHPKFNMFDKYKADKDSLVGAGFINTKEQFLHITFSIP